MTSIYEFVKEQRDNYSSQTIQIADGYEFSQYETLRTIELYDGISTRYFKQVMFVSECNGRISRRARSRSLRFLFPPAGEETTPQNCSDAM
jgi:hypothetical protein